MRLASIRLCDEMFKSRRCHSPLRGQALICGRVRRSRRGPFEAGARRYDLADISSLARAREEWRVKREGRRGGHMAQRR